MSQGTLAEAVGITYQQIQKYERGADRIGASRLYHFSKVLDVPITFFFDGLLFNGSGRATRKHRQKPISADGDDSLSSSLPREMLELMRAYNAIESDDLRKLLRNLARLVAKT